MHRAARDLMANPDTYEQGREMEARASALNEVEQFNRLIESLTEMIRQSEERKQELLRNIASEGGEGISSVAPAAGLRPQSSRTRIRRTD